MTRTSLLVASAIVALLVGLGAWWFSTEEERADQRVEPTPTDRSDDPAPTPPEPTVAPVHDAPEAATPADDPTRSEERREIVAAAGVTEIEVLLADDSPARGAKVVLFRDDEVLTQETTGDGGLVRIDRPDAPCEVAVFTSEAPPLRNPLDLDSPRQTIHLAPGAGVSGWFLVDGEPPAETVSLILFPLNGWVDEDFLPPTVWRALDTRHNRYREARTAADGAFRFDGLPAEWRRGGITAPEAYHSLARSNSTTSDEAPLAHRGTAVAGPADDLRLEYTRAVRLRGRILRAAGDPPSRRARATLEHDGLQAGGPFNTERDRADAEGRFEFALRPGVRGGQLVLTISTENGAGTREIPLGAPNPDASGIWDLGDLILADYVTLRFLVRDPAGEPVRAAAFSHRDDEKKSGWSPDRWSTNAKGLVSVEVAPGTTDFRVVAPGFRPLEVHVGPDPPDPIEVTVTASNELRIHVTAAGGALPSRTKIQIAGKDPPFEGSDTWRLPRGAVTVGGRGGSSSMHSPSGGTITLVPSKTGHLGFSGLRPGVPLTVRVVDQTGFRVHEEDVPGLGADETREVEIEITDPVRALRGRVLGPANEVVSSARLTISRVGDIQRREHATEDDGSFAIEGFLPDRVRLHVTAAGYGPFLDAEFALPPGDEEVTIHLTHARSVRVVVEDEEGAPVAEGTLQVQLESFYLYFDVQKKAPGIYEVTELPVGKVEFALYLGGRVFRRDHDTSDPELRFVVPRPSPVAVTVSSARPLDADAGRHYVELRRLDEPTTTLTLGFDPAADEQPWDLVFDAVFPGEYEVDVRRRPSDGTPEVLSRAATLTVGAEGEARRVDIEL